MKITVLNKALFTSRRGSTDTASSRPVGQPRVRGFVGALALVGVVAAAFTPTASAASTALPTPAAACEGDQVAPQVLGSSPASVSVGTTATALTFAVNAVDPCGVAGWQVRLDPMLAHGTPQIQASSGQPTITVQPPPRNAAAGWNTLSVSATDTSANSSTAQFPVRLLRQARLHSVAFARIEGGTRVQAIALLQRADWDQHTYAPYAQQRVALEFQPTGTTVWRHVKFAQSLRSGMVQATSSPVLDSRTWQAGQWRLRYPGDEFTAAAQTPAHALAAGPPPPVRAPDPHASCPNDTSAPVLGNSGLVNPLVIGMGAVKPGYQLDGTDECGIANWSIRHSRIAQLQVSKAKTVTTVNPPELNNYAGWGEMIVSAVDRSMRHNSATRSFPFRVLRQMRWLHDTRQVVRPGFSVPGQPAKALVISAHLVKANWAQPGRGWVPARGMAVALQFQPRGQEQGPWLHKGFAFTNDQGKATAVWRAPAGWSVEQLAAAYTGSWRLQYLGTDVHSASTLDQVSITWAASPASQR